MTDSSGSYEVGYGKPPKHTRFPKGQSGNLKGRPKGSKNLKTLARKVLLQPVTLRDKSGKPRKFTTLEAALLRMRSLALGLRPTDKPVNKLEYAAMTTLVEWARSLGLEGEDSQTPETGHAEILAAYRKRKGLPPNEGGGHA